MNAATSSIVGLANAVEVVFGFSFLFPSVMKRSSSALATKAVCGVT